MAELILSQNNGRRKVQVPRIDLTPMVDLGFLLITFFMYTTTMMRLKTIEINLPDPSPTTSPTEFIEESTITIIPSAAHKIYYYEGNLKQETLPVTNFNDVGGIRDILLKKQDILRSLPATFSPEAHKLFVLIKPADNCTYDDLVRIMDEMSILNVPYYAITDLKPEEKKILDNVQ